MVLKVLPFMVTFVVCSGLSRALELVMGRQWYQGLGEVGEQRPMGEKDFRKKEIALDGS